MSEDPCDFRKNGPAEPGPSRESKLHVWGREKQPDQMDSLEKQLQDRVQNDSMLTTGVQVSKAATHHWHGNVGH